VEIESPQAMAAESSSASIILLSSSFGYSLSTTHVAAGSIIGTGIGKPGAEVRWADGERPGAHPPMLRTCRGGRLRAANAIGGTAGVIVDLLVLLAACALFHWRSRASKVDHNNVNVE
jgi:PiT family inorganic phosphate transporter